MIKPVRSGPRGYLELWHFPAQMYDLSGAPDVNGGRQFEVFIKSYSGSAVDDDIDVGEDVFTVCRG